MPGNACGVAIFNCCVMFLPVSASTVVDYGNLLPSSFSLSQGCHQAMCTDAPLWSGFTVSLEEHP